MWGGTVRFPRHLGDGVGVKAKDDQQLGERQQAEGQQDRQQSEEEQQAGADGKIGNTD